MNKEKLKELHLRAESAIHLCLTKNVLVNVQKILLAKNLWEKLEELYQAKDISNRLLMKEQFYHLRMDDNMKFSDHFSALNGIVSKL